MIAIALLTLALEGTPAVSKDSANAGHAVSSAELKYLEKRLRGRSTARLSRHGTRVEVSEPRPTPEGLRFTPTQATSALPNPVAWSEVDTLWVRGDRAASFAWLGLAAGAVMGRVAAGDQEGAGEYAGLAVPSVTATTALGGAGLAALVGARLVTWVLVYPIDPRKLRARGLD